MKRLVHAPGQAMLDLDAEVAIEIWHGDAVTKVHSVDDPAPTMKARGMGAGSNGEVYVTRLLDSVPLLLPLDAPVPEMTHEPLTGDRNGPRCIEIPADAPAPTIMAGGIGGAQVVNYGGYDVKPTDAPIDLTKPPYRIPLMSEIAQLPKNGLVVVSTFSGCGGSCLGFKMAGYDVLWANEFIPAAQDTYRANHPATHLDTSDIRQVTAASIRAVIGDREIDVFEGSPPCASFSTAGKTSRGWKQVRKYSDTEQRTDDLFDEYVRLVSELRPRAFVAENVAGMIKGVSVGKFDEYLEKFRSLPYQVFAQVLDAASLGVPQRRLRVIFIGVRNDVATIPLAFGKPVGLFPARLKKDDGSPLVYSVRDAIPWIARMHDQYGAYTEGGPGNSTRDKKTLEVDVAGPAPTVRAALSDQFRATVDGDEASAAVEAELRASGQPFISVKPNGNHPNQYIGLDNVMPTVRANGAPQYGIEEPMAKRIHHDESVGDHVGASLDGYAVGEEWDKLKPGEQSEKFFSLVKTDPDQPCQTVTAAGATTSAIGAPGGVASVTHPYERRKFTLLELRRICGFPDDFVLTGTYAQGWERLGRAVPPPMMKAVAESLRKILCAE